MNDATKEGIEEIFAGDDVFECEDIFDVGNTNETNGPNETKSGTTCQNIRSPDSTTLLATLNEIARKTSTNKLFEGNHTLSRLSGIEEKRILKNLQALQKEGAITLKYQKATIRGNWITSRTIVIK